MFEYFCVACGDIADPRYWTNGEHLCHAHWVKFYSTDTSI